MYTYKLEEQVALLSMENGENRFNLASIDAFKSVLTEIENDPQVNAMVVTSADAKIWCNGIDLEGLLPEIQSKGETALNPVLAELYRLYQQILTLPIPTVAAINGHAFGGGAFLAFCLDFRFMRSDRGWICLPEVDLGMPLGPVLTAISKRVVPLTLLEEMQYTARRLTAQECVERHIINRVCSLESLLDEAMAFARALNKPRQIIRQMKRDTLAPILSTIDKTVAALKG